MEGEVRMEVEVEETMGGITGGRELSLGEITDPTAGNKISKIQRKFLKYSLFPKETTESPMEPSPSRTLESIDLSICNAQMEHFCLGTPRVLSRNFRFTHSRVPRGCQQLIRERGNP